MFKTTTKFNTVHVASTASMNQYLLLLLVI